MEKYKPNEPIEILIPKTETEKEIPGPKLKEEAVEEIIESERGLLSRFRGKAGKIARCMVLMSVFSVGGAWVYEKITGSKNIEWVDSERIKQMSHEEMFSWVEDNHYNILEGQHFLKEIQERKDGPDIIKKILEIMINNKEFDLMFKNYDLYKDNKELAKKIVEKAIEVGGDEYILRYGNIIYKSRPDLMDTSLKRIYKTNPGDLFRHMEKLAKLPFINEEVLENSARHAAKKGNADFLKNFTLIANKPYAKIILKDNIQLMNAYGYWPELLSYFFVFKGEPYAEEILDEIYRQRPGLLVRYFPSYKGSPFAEKLFEKSLRKASTDFFQLGVVLEQFGLYQDKPYAQEILKIAVENGAELNPSVVLKYNQTFLGNSYAEKVIKRAAEKDPDAFLSNYEDYQDQPYVGGLLKKSAESAALIAPRNIFYHLRHFKNKPYAEKVLESAVGKDPGAALARTENLQDLDFREKILERASRRAANIDPFSVFEYLDFIEKQSYGREVISAALQKSLEVGPASIIRSAREISKLSNGREFIIKAVKSKPSEAGRWNLAIDLKEILEKEQDPVIKTILEVNQRNKITDPKTERPAISLSIIVLLEKIINEKLTLEDAQKIFENHDSLLKALIEIKSKPNHLARFDVEEMLSNEALHAVYIINSLHNSPDKKRFASIEGYDSQKLYALMVYGEEEIYTSSFNGVFNRLLDRMKKEGISGDQLLGGIGYNKFRNFIKLCSGFNRLQEFLDTMDANSQKKILEMFINNIEKEQDMLSQAVVVADVFSALEESEILKVFQTQIKKEYERVKNEKNSEGMAIYGLLAGMFGNKAVINEAWLKDMSKKYKLPPITELPSNNLFNKDGSNVQQYFFYDDEDGQASFKSFLAQYKGSKEWEIIKNKDKYIVIKSKGGKIVEIYANKPEHEDEGTEEISKLLKKRNISSLVVVHRGHSYHASKTIDRIPVVAKIVSLGSCGGYNNLDGVLQRAPDAHILSTKGTGTMLVNDPVLKMINEKIKDGKNLNWPNIWEEADKKLGNNPNFLNYVPPHKNLGVVFLKAYHKTLPQNGK